MFDNLVESSSHKDDIARKGSFIFVTGADLCGAARRVLRGRYLLVRRHLGEMELELTTLVAPVPVPRKQKQPEQKQEAKPVKAGTER